MTGGNSCFRDFGGECNLPHFKHHAFEGEFKFYQTSCPPSARRSVPLRYTAAFFSALTTKPSYVHGLNEAAQKERLVLLRRAHAVYLFLNPLSSASSRLCVKSSQNLNAKTRSRGKLNFSLPPGSPPSIPPGAAKQPIRPQHWLIRTIARPHTPGQNPRTCRQRHCTGKDRSANHFRWRDRS